MILPEIKSLYLKKLTHLYPDTEIESFFYLLLEHHFKKKKIDLALEPELLTIQWQSSEFEAALDQLLDEKPIQYILGSTEFAGLSFKVNENVLIPRPETEELVNWILDTVNPREHIKILDIGSGSGCIPITLAKKLPHADVHALDVSNKALEVAQDNAKTLKAKVNFYQCDILKVNNLRETYDILVSNPPYVRLSEKSLMRGNVLRHEPEVALYVEDEDPLLFYRKIADLGHDDLKSGGLLFFEINEGLAESTRQILTEMRYEKIEIKKDIYEKDRMIRAFKK